MKQFLIFLSVLVCLSIHAIGQNINTDLFQQPVNTGVNMTLAIDTSSFDQYEGGQIDAFFDSNVDDGSCEYINGFCEQDQWLLPFEGNTGSNMTLLLQESFVTSLNIQTSNAYIVATTSTSFIPMPSS